MEINFVQGEAADIMALNGRLDGPNPTILNKKLSEQLRTRSRIIIDLSQVSFIDSNGLGVLVAGLKKAIRNKGDIRLVNPTAAVRMLMEITRVDRVFQVYSSRELALNSYSENEPGNKLRSSR